MEVFGQHAAEKITAITESMPDEKKWMLAFAKALGVTYVSELTARLAFTDPPELLSMSLCLYANFPADPAIDWAQVLARLPQMRERVRRYRKDTGLTPHPNVAFTAGFE